MTKRSTSADFVTAFATGWPENQPDLMVLSLTTAQRRSGFRVQQGSGAAGRKDHAGNRFPAEDAQNRLTGDVKADRTGLRARQRNRGAFEHGICLDHDGLLVAARGQGDIRVKAGRTGDDLEIAVAAVALQGARDAAGGFAPSARQCAAAIDDVGGKIEFVAVAGAGQGLVEPGSAGTYGIGCATADALTRSVIKANAYRCRTSCRRGPRTVPIARSLKSRTPIPQKPWLRPTSASASARRPLLCFGYCRDASHRPLHGTPADAPFHFPDPTLPLSCPFAYAPWMETRTSPSRPTLPETSAPAAETLPSATVRVERWRSLAAAAFCHDGHTPKPVIRRLGGSRSRRNRRRCGKKRTTKYGTNAIMAHDSDPRICCDDAVYSGIMCSKFAAPR